MYLLIWRSRLISTIVVHHRAAKSRTIQWLGCWTHTVLEGQWVLSRGWHVVFHGLVRAITKCAEDAKAAA